MYQYRYYATTGRLQQIAAPDGGLLDYSWDGFLPLSESWQGDISGSVNQSWNNNSRLLEQCVNNDQCVNFSYDDDGLLTQAGALILQRDAANGLLNGAVLGAVMSDYSYNQFGELTGAALTHDNNTLANMSHTRDSLGRIVTRSETAAGATFSDGYDYDLAGRLVGVVRNGQGTTWQYDSNGNRTHENGQLIASYDQQDRLLHYRGATYQYTANGELSSKSEGGATTHYQYDELGNLVRVVLVGNIELDYVIDGRNRRIGKKVNGELVQGFLYQDQLNPVAELDGEGNVISRFVYAEKVNVPSYMIKGGNAYRIFSDHLGSPRLIVDIDTGAVAQRIVYDVWGNVTEDTNPGFQPFGFAGGVYDQHTKLTRFGARDYDPETGRWTAKDPVRFKGDGTNLCSYAWNSPVVYFDPHGLWSWPGFSGAMDYWSQAAGAAGDFLKNYQDMRDAGWKGADKYFHCKANCESAQRGVGGVDAACAISDSREWWDQNVKGYPLSDSVADQAANEAGRNEGEVNGSDSCSKICDGFRPAGLPARY
jgi:RHS repeat-associated protein